MEENAIIAVNTDIDYTPYSEDDEKQIELLLDKIETAEKNVKLGVLKIGEYLTQLKAIVLKHGEWENWLDNNVKFSKETAVRYMGLYEEFGLKASALTDFKDFGKSKLYILKTLNENEREPFRQEKFCITGNNGKSFIDKTIDMMSTREFEYVVKTYKKLKLSKVIKIVNDTNINVEKIFEKKTTQDEQLKRLEEIYKGYIKNKIEQKEMAKDIEEILSGTSQELTEEPQEKYIDEVVEEMWIEIIRDTITDTQKELDAEAEVYKPKINYGKIGNEVFKLFSNKSEDDVIKEITNAIKHYRNFISSEELRETPSETSSD